MLERINRNPDELRRDLADFQDKLNPGAIGVFYFAGHGVQVGRGLNYLLPVGVEYRRERDAELFGLEAGSVLRRMEESGAGLSLLILDACRDSPLPTEGRSTKTRGLGRMEAPSGSLIAFATAPGSTADENPNRRNGLYTEHLLKHIETPGLRIEDVFKRVRVDVEGATNRRQSPEEISKLTGDFFFRAVLASSPSSGTGASSPQQKPPQSSGVRLGDLEASQQQRSEWAQWQSRMKADFDRVQAFSGSFDLKVTAWDRFLEAWAADNPHSREDDELRTRARQLSETARREGLQRSAISKPPIQAHQEPLKAAWIYVGPVGDAGWSFAHDLGRKAVVAKFGSEVQTTFVEKVPEGPDAERVIRDLARQGNKIIFATSFGYMDAMQKVAAEFPNVKFEHALGYKTSPNMRIYDARFYQDSYMAGMIAGRMTRTKVLGYVASFPIPEVMRNINAFTLGAQSVNPEIRTKVIWVNTWFDPPKESEAAQRLINQNADVLLQSTDSTAVLQVAEKNGKYAFGWDSDMSAFAPKAHLASAAAKWGQYYIKAIEEVRDGTWKTVRTVWGVKEGVNGLSKISSVVPEETVRRLRAIESGLKDGSFEIFTGPIIDNTGKERLPANVKADQGWKDRVNFYVKGVEGRVPGS